MYVGLRRVYSQILNETSTVYFSVSYHVTFAIQEENSVSIAD